MLTLRLRSWLVAGAGVVAFVAAALVVASGSTAHGAVSVGTVAPSSRVLQHYGAFRRSAVASDALGATSIAEGLESTGAAARRQPTKYSELSQWATAEGETLCVVSRFTPAGSPGAADTNRACDSAEYLETHDQLMIQASLVGSTSSAPPEPGSANVISGLAPDGVSAVTLEFADGSQQLIPVYENGFTDSLSVPKTLKAISWSTASGQINTQNS